MNRIYKHFKGGIYRFLCESVNSETMEKEVTYQALYGECQIWTRPASMFYGLVTLSDGRQVKRFTELSGQPVYFKKVHPDSVIPRKAYDDDFCYDCVAVSCEEIKTNVFKYGLGFALQIADREKPSYLSRGFTIRPRSSVWKTGMVLSNSLGTVDDSYTGEISAVFYRVIPGMEIYKPGDRICQLHLDFAENIDFFDSDCLQTTGRGDNGYGSTGLKG